MARQVWYVNDARAKVTVTAGTASAAIHKIVLESGETTPHEVQWKRTGDTISSTEASAAVAEQNAGAVPSRTSATGSQDPTSETGTTDHVYPAGKGPIVKDSTNGHTYRIGTTNGTLTATQVT